MAVTPATVSEVLACLEDIFGGESSVPPSLEEAVRFSLDVAAGREALGDGAGRAGGVGEGEREGVGPSGFGSWGQGLVSGAVNLSQGGLALRCCG